MQQVHHSCCPNSYFGTGLHFTQHMMAHRNPSTSPQQNTRSPKPTLLFLHASTSITTICMTTVGYSWRDSSP